jgi:hypothetical protein
MYLLISLSISCAVGLQLFYKPKREHTEWRIFEFHSLPNDKGNAKVTVLSLEFKYI